MRMKLVFLFIIFLVSFLNCDEHLGMLSKTINTPANKMINYISGKSSYTEYFFDDNVYVYFQDDRTVGKWRLDQDGSIFLYDLNTCGLVGVGETMQSNVGAWFLYSDYEFAVSPVPDHLWKNGKVWSSFSKPFLSGKKSIDSYTLDFIDLDEYHANAYKSIEKSDYINGQIEMLILDFQEEKEEHERILQAISND